MAEGQGIYMNLNRKLEGRRKAAVFFVVGICLVGFAMFAPDAGPHRDWGFIHVARQASWHRPLDWEAAWCSLKIILLSLGLCLIIEACGTLLMKFEHELMGFLVYLLHIVPVLGFLAGSYYLIKSLV